MHNARSIRLIDLLVIELKGDMEFEGLGDASAGKLDCRKLNWMVSVVMKYVMERYGLKKRMNDAHGLIYAFLH